MPLPILKPQEIPLDHPDSIWMFQPNGEKPFVSTPAALETYCVETILACLMLLQQKARDYKGLDYVQVFEDPSKPENLWYIEDGDGGAITALLPSDY
ncbi:MAG: hypothetical protein AAFN77_03055 [Planctomycetota bacterium]